MTKTFWAYWQKRIGETENIYLFTDCKTCHHPILNRDDKLIKAIFKDNYVDLIIERNNLVMKNGKYHYHTENEYTTYNRNEIASIKFKG